jgi:predicted ATPase/DNA-binding SARP family transcriptional activator
LLGPLEVVAEGRQLPLKAAKQKTILALLLLHRDEVVSVDRMQEALWQERPPATATTALQGYVSQLRRLLEEGEEGSASLLATRSPGYALAAAPEQLDLARFEQLAESGRDALATGEPARAARLLAEALALWRGPPLADFSYEAWAQSAIGRLEELRLSAVEDRIEADLACGRHGRLVGELEALVQSHPLRERLRAQLMLALYRGGRQAEALQAYQQARTALVSDLGIDPSPELQQLYKAILNQEQALAAAAPGSPSNLPTPPTPLVGRHEELTDLRGLLERSDVRLLTLTGAGGSGKTRLALELAGGAASEFPDGVWWVPLAALADPALVLPEIAQTVGARNGLTDHLRRQNTLLLLDNFEQVVEAATGLAELLAQASDVKVLATSRVALRLSGEHEWPVPPLEDEDAAALFGERARAVKPTFEPDEHVTKICTRLDNMPLALELAAARVNVLAPEQILERLGHSLDLLTTGKRDAPERHRTLRATVEWSYNLLSETEQHLFARLAVFAGGYSLEAAEQVCEADLDVLGALIDKNLLQQTDDGRLFMLETIREYALERLDAAPDEKALRRRHADHALRRAEPPNALAERREWHAAIERDYADFWAALVWLRDEGEHAQLLTLVSRLGPFWDGEEQLHEGRAWLEEALTHENETTVDSARALGTLAHIVWRQGDLELALSLVDDAASVATDLGERQLLGEVQSTRGAIHYMSGDLSSARTEYEHALALFRDLGSNVDVAILTHDLGLIALTDGDGERARTLLEESLRLSQENAYDRLEMSTFGTLGLLELEENRSREAKGLLRRAFELSLKLDAESAAIAEGLVAFAAVTAGEREPMDACLLIGASDAHYDRIGAVREPVIAAVRTRTLEHAKSMIGPDAAEAARAQGGELSLTEAVEHALSLD